MTSPTQLTLKLLKKEGYLAQVVERWNAFAHIRQDLFGFIDVVAIKPGETGVLGIQTTSRDNQGKRVEKIRTSENLDTWLAAKNRVEVWGWSKKGKAGKRKLWSVNREKIT